jgi:hypothetical protein
VWSFNITTTKGSTMSQPYFGQVWGWSPTLGKVGIWSPPGLPNVQSSTEWPKTSCIGVFLVSLESSWNVDIENGLALPFGHLQPKLRAKEGSGVKLPVWLPTIKSWELTSSRCPIWECDMELKRSQRGLQLWFRPRHDQTLQSGVMAVQSSRSPAGTISGVPTKCAIWM